MASPEWSWRSPPNWPPAPPGWRPPEGWFPPPQWGPAPPGWSFWQTAVIPDWMRSEESVPVVVTDPAARRQLVWETRFVMLAFLFPVVVSAVIIFAQHVSGVGDVTRFPTLVRHDALLNMVLGILDYASIGMLVPLTLFLLHRTGQSPGILGLGFGRLRFGADVWPGLGLAAAAYGAEIPLSLVVVALTSHARSAVNTVGIGHVPHYYVLYGLAMSFVTAVTEEVLVNGYLMTRLAQLGWSPRLAITLSLILRTSYHVYYGLGFLLTIPFGWFVTRSFQKHRRLNRPIVAHFLFDAVIFTIAILA